jgi:hypothetical protein
MKLHFNGQRIAWTLGPASGEIAADCQVRNELFEHPRDERPLGVKKQVVYADTGNRYDKIPYMPRTFPEGLWVLNTPRAKPPEDTYLWPWYIPTDAWQWVKSWALDENGGYQCIDLEGKQVIDKAYGIHYSKSRTTLGCIHVLSEHELCALTGMVFSQILAGKINTLEVKYGN